MITRLTPKASATRYPAVESMALRVYGPYQAMLTRPAWEALGSPSCIAIEYDDAGYSIVATTREDKSAIKVYKSRAISVGVIAEQLRGLAFPVSIALLPEDGRLRFGDVG